MYYEEQWIEGALCWRTSPNGAWTRYTANELAHRYESAEKRAADAQATVEALQAQLDKTNLENAYANNETQNILRGGILERDVKISTLRQQVEALQRELESANALLYKKNCAIGKAETTIEALQREHTQLQALVRALLGTWVNGRKIHDGIPMTLRQQIDATLDATTPATKGGDGE